MVNVETEAITQLVGGYRADTRARAFIDGLAGGGGDRSSSLFRGQVACPR
jgi:hypothetical protein